MAVKKRSLGRGLDVLLKSAVNVSVNTEDQEAELRRLPIESVVRGRYQPRNDIREDTLQELAESIRAQGMVQPIVVRPIGSERYEIIAGERRWRAAQLIGLAQIPAVIRDVPDPVAMAMALIENIQREDLNPLEEATALQRLGEEFGMTHQAIAEAIGRSRAAVSNLLRLLDLCEEVRQLVQERKLEMGHARALLSLTPTLQREAARQILIRGLSVRETEQLVRDLQNEPAGRPQKKTLDPNIRTLQDELSERLGAKVRFQHSVSGKGRLVIHYNTLDELDGILARVK